MKIEHHTYSPQIAEHSCMVIEEGTDARTLVEHSYMKIEYYLRSPDLVLLFYDAKNYYAG
jgi:hypothetical protein